MKFTVWSVKHCKYVGLCPNHMLQLSDRPFVETTYSDAAAAAHTAHSLTHEFDETFIVRRI